MHVSTHVLAYCVNIYVCTCVSFLEHAVEDMKMDVVQRRCKVVEEEVNTLTKILNTVTHSIKNIKGKCSLGNRVTESR